MPRIISLLLALSPLGVWAAREPNVIYPPTACTDSGACSQDAYCRADPSAFDEAYASEEFSSEGVCVFRNTYEPCIVSRRSGPDPCPGSMCVNDPRNPKDCQLSCDGPGMCLNLDALESCDPSDVWGCPEGLWCYARLDVVDQGVCM